MPILEKKLLKPVSCEDLIRVGGIYDGGYVVPNFALGGTKGLLSLGISDDISFELALLKINPDIRVIGYDHTVNIKRWLRRSVKHFIRMFYYSVFNRLKFAKYKEKFFVAIKLMNFFGGRHAHIKKRIGRADGQTDQIENIATAISRFSDLKAHEVFLKMDIEGSEYEVVDDISLHHDRINVIAAEFHQLDTSTEKFNGAIKQLAERFYCVHVHGNNYGGYSEINNFPCTVEITWVHKNLFKSTPIISDKSLPIEGLDSPCKPGFKDYPIIFD